MQQRAHVARAACRQQPAAHKPCSSLPPQPGFAVWGSPAGQATQNNTINGISARGSFNTVASALFKHFFSQGTLKTQNQRPDRGSTPSLTPVDTFLSTHDSTKRSPRRPSQALSPRVLVPRLQTSHTGVPLGKGSSGFFPDSLLASAPSAFSHSIFCLCCCTASATRASIMASVRTPSSDAYAAAWRGKG